MVGVGIAEFPLLDNTDKVNFNVDVAPTLRRRGIGPGLMGFRPVEVNAEFQRKF